MRKRCCGIWPVFIAILILIPSARAAAQDMLIRATVQRVLAPRIFTLEYTPGVDGELIVLAAEAEATPVPGVAVLAGGVLRQVSEAELTDAAAWKAIDDRTRGSLLGRPILVATSLRTATGRQLVRASPLLRQPPPGTPREPARTRARPDQIEELSGSEVRILQARVLAVINPRALLIESALPLSPMIGGRDRLIVLVQPGGIRVDAAAIVGTNVTVLGTARTVLGLQVSGEVPWPTELTRARVDQLDVRGAVLATSVQTDDGVELTNRP